MHLIRAKSNSPLETLHHLNTKLDVLKYAEINLPRREPLEKPTGLCVDSGVQIAVETLVLNKKPSESRKKQMLTHTY
jgi:hypothetical protein